MKLKEGLFTAPKLYRAIFIYRISPLLACAATIAFLWILVLLEASSSPRLGFLLVLILCISLFMLLLGGLLSLLTLGTCILVAPEGLLYRSMGTCVYTPWANIEDVEKKTMGAFTVENLRLRRTAVDGLSLEEGIREQTAVITKIAAVRASEESLPALRWMVLILGIINLFSGHYTRLTVTRATNPSLQKYIPVGLFGSAWKHGGLGSDIAQYRSIKQPRSAASQRG